MQQKSELTIKDIEALQKKNKELNEKNESREMLLKWLAYGLGLIGSFMITSMLSTALQSLFFTYPVTFVPYLITCFCLEVIILLTLLIPAIIIDQQRNSASNEIAENLKVINSYNQGLLESLSHTADTTLEQTQESSSTADQPSAAPTNSEERTQEQVAGPMKDTKKPATLRLSATAVSFYSKSPTVKNSSSDDDLDTPKSDVSEDLQQRSRSHSNLSFYSPQQSSVQQPSSEVIRPQSAASI